MGLSLSPTCFVGFGLMAARSWDWGSGQTDELRTAWSRGVSLRVGTLWTLDDEAETDGVARRGAARQASMYYTGPIPWPPLLPSASVGVCGDRMRLW